MITVNNDNYFVFFVSGPVKMLAGQVKIWASRKNP